MTVNKIQGQTIPHVRVYLPNHVFSHEQLYVTLSKGISMATTKILVKTENFKRQNETYKKKMWSIRRFYFHKYDKTSFDF